MKITLVHQYYLRPGQPGGPRFNVMARAWADAGHDVTVIAGQVNYASGEKPEDLRGALFHEEYDGPVRVLRVYTPSTYHSGYVGRALSLGGFAVSAALALARSPEADVVLVTSPPLTVGLPAMVARARGERVVFEVRDLWPESAVATGVLSESGLLTRALYALEAASYRVSDHIVALTPAIAEDIERRGFAAPGQVSMLPNGADDKMIDRPLDEARRRIIRERHGWTGKFVVLYPGAHGLANALWQLVEAAKLLEHREDIVLAAVGDGARKEALMEMASSLGVAGRMSWLDPVGRDEIVDVIDAADCVAAVLMRTDTFKTVYPNKIFDAMARARPTLLAIDGVARALVEGAGAGVFVEPERPAKLAAAIEALADDPELCERMGAAGRSLVIDRFDRRQLSSAYEELLSSLVK